MLRGDSVKFLIDWPIDKPTYPESCTCRGVINPSFMILHVRFIAHLRP